MAAHGEVTVFPTSYAYSPTSGYGPLSGGSIFNLGGYMKASTVYNNKAFSSEQLF